MPARINFADSSFQASAHLDISLPTGIDTIPIQISTAVVFQAQNTFEACASAGALNIRA
jgi:hypothetical protein